MSAAESYRIARRPLVFAATLMATFTVAIEGTIVATSMPSIVAELGGFQFYAWVFSIFLLTQAVTTPIYGKLADTFGRKPVLMGGMTLFMLGSLACGFATSMTMLIAFRFFQGFGAGAVQPIAMTIVGDLYSMEERGRVQGYIASVWGISSIVGPLGGAVLVQYAGWHWVFWAGIPFGLAAMLLLSLHLHEHLEHRRTGVDFAGAALLFVSLSALILALTMSGEWTRGGIAGLLVVAVTAGWMLLAHVRRTPDPIINLELWTQPLIARANLAGLLAGVVMIGPVSFLPLFVQGVLGGSALAAGFVLCMMSIGWPIASTLTGRLFTRLGTRKPARLGGAMLVAGTFILALAGSYAALVAAFGSFLIGVGMGLLTTSFLYSIQASVGWAQRGAATASMVLTRALGNAFGAALFGGLINFSLHNYLERHGAQGLTLDSVRMLLSGHAAALQGAQELILKEGLAASLQLVFWTVTISALLCLAASWQVPELEARKTRQDG